MYKDIDKQREANRKAQAKFKAKGITKGITSEGITDKVLPAGTFAVRSRLDKDYPHVELKPKRGKDIKCFADLSPSVQQAIDKDSMFKGKIDRAIKIKRTEAAIRYQHAFPDRYDLQDAVISGPAVTGKPGDADYNGVCTEAWRAERGR